MTRTAFVIMGVVLSALARAQVPLPPSIDPGAIQQRQIEEERRRQELERLERKPIINPIAPPEAEKPPVKAAPDAIRFLVKDIEFTPSEILSREELEAVARDYRGRELALADLQQLADRVNKLYAAKGVVTARAVVPPQDVSSGIVRIRLVEGRLGKIDLEGNQTTSEGYVKWRLGLKPGSLVDLKKLERELIWFNRTTDAQLQAELKAGEQFGTTDLHLQILEPPRHDLRLFADNLGTRSTGENRHGVTYINRSVLGFRDDLSLTVTLAEGLESYGFGYGVPINRWGGHARYSFYRDYTDVVNGILAPLNISGFSEAHLLSLRQPAYVTSNFEFDLTGGYTKRNSANWISGIFLQSTKTESGNLGAEIQRSFVKGYALAAYGVTFGHATVVERSDYAIGRGTLRGAYDIGGWSARGSVFFQHSDSELLPSSEQISIGGEGTVRGYSVGTFSGDDGYTANIELHHALGSFTRENEGIDLYATGFLFADYGYVRPFRPPNSTLRGYEELSSAGFGVNLTFLKRIFLRGTFAYAMNELPQEPRRYRINFQLVTAVF